MAGSSPKQQAQQAAQGAVPTIGSINRQYGQSISDVENFTTALARLLGGMPSAQGAYNTAIQQQGGIDNAAQAALRATGTPYAAGSGAAVAGLGSSALSNLNARGAAAGAYSATLPHVAAARGTLGVQTLESAKQNALQTRSDAYKQAYLSALAQARQNAEQMRQFNVQTGLTRQQMAQSAAQNAASLAEQQREFNITNAYRYAALGVGSSSAGSAGSIAKSLGLSQNELDTHVSDATKLLQGEQPQTARVPVYGTRPDGSRYIKGYQITRVGGTGSPGAVQAGVPFAQAVQTLIQQGIRPQIALLATARIYKSARPINGYAWETFVHWMANHGNARYARTWRKLGSPAVGEVNPGAPHPP